MDDVVMSSASTAPRPFRVLGVQQLAIGAMDKSKLLGLWRDLLGLEVVGQFQSAKENVDEDIAVTGTGPWKVEIDLMQPMDAQASPRVHQPPLNHIGLWVDKLHEAYSWLQKKGVRMAPGGIRRGASGFEICFIHPKANEQHPLCGEGVLIELVQAPESLIEFFEQHASAPIHHDPC